jgi:molybdopterin synthase sulfur carrier subunit
VSAVIVRLPAALRTSGQPGMVDLAIPSAATVALVLTEIEKRIPGSTTRIVDDAGKLRGYVNLYVNGDDIRHGSGLDTPVADSDEVLILPAISGG